MSAGSIIYLNGTSSAGKSSVAAALQAVLPVPYVLFSLDRFNGMFPARYVAVQPFGQAIPPLAHQGMLLLHEMLEGGLRLDTRLGPAARRFVTGMRHTIRALALTGNNVIVDDVLYDRALLTECVAVLAGLPVTFVKVYCPLAEVERREQERGDRILGLAAWQLERVHDGVVYDLEVDTSRHSTIECAQQIAQFIANLPARSAFAQLPQSLA